MSFTPDEIEFMEQMANRLHNVFNELSTSPQLSPVVGYYDKFISLAKEFCFEQILEWAHRRKFRDETLQTQYEKLLSEADKLDKAIMAGQCNFYTHAGLIQKASTLAKELRSIAKTARKEGKRRTFKLIFYITSAVVAFLAALLTCIYLLWWLWTKLSA